MTTEATSIAADPETLFNLDGIVRDALQASGVEMTPEQFLQEYPRIEALQIFLAQAKAQAAYSGPGPAAYQRAAFVDQLVQRIRLFGARRAEPERFERPLSRPLVVTGLMRTGTTLLYNLLAAQEGTRAAKLWELWAPVPISAKPNEGDDPRIVAGEHRANWIKQLVPDIRFIHDIIARAPEECTYLMMDDFCTDALILTGENRPYTEWFKRQDVRDFYRHHRAVFSYLDSFDSPTSHWVLKSPYHIWHLPELFDLYPDVNVVVTHRNPVEVVASTISLLTLAPRRFVPNYDPQPTARHILREMAGCMQSAKAAREQLASTGRKSRVLDVAYRDVMADPVAVVKSIYQQFDYVPSSSLEENIRSHLAANPKDKEGVHKYSLEQFGLSAAEVETELAEYIAAFGHFWR